VSYSVMSSLSPLNRWVPKIEFTFILSSCPVHHLSMTKLWAWCLFNRSCPVYHL